MTQTRITTQDILDGTIVNADVNASAAIAATKIHDGSVTNTHFGFLSGVASQVDGISDARTLENKVLTGTTNTVTATYLRNADGSQVLVSGANPSNGQHLVASSATQAAWETPAGGLATSNFVFNEVPSGLIDNVNDIFTLANTPSPTESLRLFKNGIRLTPGATEDYTLSTATITFNALNVPQSGTFVDMLLADYMKA